MIKFFPVLILSICISSPTLAQISGLVKDKNTGKMLEGVEVFINNSSWRSITDKEGSFVLDGIYPGFFDLVLYKKGYVIFKSSIRIQEDRMYKLNLTLQVDETPRAAKVKKDAQWNNNYLWFQRGLIGLSDLSAGYKIENTQSLRFELSDDLLKAQSEDPLWVENPELGLSMNVYLQQFEANVASAKFQAFISYQVKSSEDYNVQSAWERNRLKSYWGSSRHLFQSWVTGTCEREGFTFRDADKTISGADLVSDGSFPGYFKINIDHPIGVVYQMESGSSGLVGNKSGQTSTLIPKESIEVNELGILFNAKSVEISGSMAETGLAEYLPINYLPASTIEDEKLDWQNFALLREKVYVHTDRDYYYPRENLWFKAYVGYSMPVLKDTISRTLYVELISPGKKVIDSKIYRIKDGAAIGDFKLDENLTAGEYYIRAYTNWMRNYGDSALFVKAVPVLNLNENIEFTQTDFKNNGSQRLIVSANKESYKAREKVEIQVHVMDEHNLAIPANLSISVTDAVTAVSLPSVDITDPRSLKLEAQGAPNKYFDQITHFMERGLSFRGVVKDGKGIPTPARLEIIQGNMDNLISMETDEQGEFLVTGVNFMDSLVFAFKPVNRKGKPLERVEILPREIPPMTFDVKPLSFALKKEDVLQRIQNSYRAEDDVRMLNEVEIKSSRLAKDAPDDQVRIYGEPDYVVKGENLRSTNVGTNLLVGLQGKVPGLQVVESMDGGGLPIIRVKVARSGSFASSTEPLILVDGVPFPDAQSISALDPSRVERVEVVTRAAPQYGSRGSNGVIAIYLKSGYTVNSEKNYLSHKIPGYNATRPFYAPDYSGKENASNPDFRTTIFWMPELKTDAKGNASVNFYTADLATKYRVVVEGVTDQGEPLKSVSYITVE